MCKQLNTAFQYMGALTKGVMKHGAGFLCFLCVKFLPAETVGENCHLCHSENVSDSGIFLCKEVHVKGWNLTRS